MVSLGVASGKGFIIKGNDKSNPFFATAEAVHNAKEALRHPRLSNRVTKGMETLIAAIVSDNFVRRQGQNGKRWAALDPDTITKRARQKDAGFVTAVTKKLTRIPKGKKGAGRFKSELKKGKAARRLFPQRTEKGDFTGGVSKRTVGMAVGEALALREKKSATGPLRKKKQQEFASGIIPLVDTGGLFKSVGVQFTEGAAKLLAATHTEGSVKDEGTWTGGHALKWTLEKNKITISPKGLRGKAKLKFAVHNRPTGQMLKAGRGSRIPGREFFYLNKADTELITRIFMALAMTTRYRRPTVIGTPKELQTPLYSTVPEVAKKWKAYTRAFKVGSGEYGAQRYYEKVPTREKGTTGWRKQASDRTKARGGDDIKQQASTVERRQKDVFTAFLNNADHAQNALAASDADGMSLISMVQQQVIRRLESAGVFELATGVNVRQNALKHLRRRGK